MSFDRSCRDGQLSLAHLFGIAGDQASAPLAGEIRPKPIGHDREPVSKSDEEEYMYEEPCEPGDKALQF